MAEMQDQDVKQDDIDFNTELLNSIGLWQNLCVAKQEGQDIKHDDVDFHEESLNSNYIGLLQNLCVARCWLMPVYETVGEQGKPHARVYTVTCKIAHLEESGSGRTKKLARHIAAHKMFLRLNGTDKKTNSNDAGSEPMVNSSVAKCDYVKLLLEVTQQHNINVKLKLIDNDDGDGERDGSEEGVLKPKTIIIRMKTMPVGICSGSGDTVDEAKQNAARTALDYIKLIEQKK